MGGCAKNTAKDGSKDGKDGKEGKEGTNRFGLGGFSNAPQSEGFDIGVENKIYLVNLSDRDGSPLTDELLSAHLSHLDSLTQLGKLDSANAYASGHCGSLILIAESQDEATQIIESDPLILSKFYKTYEIIEMAAS